MKKFCESLREHAIKVINFKKKKINYLEESTRNRINLLYL